MDSTVVKDEDAEMNRSNASAESQPRKCITGLMGKPSVVWEHFTKVNVSAGCTRALCKQCKQSLVYINGSKCAGTSHLKRHIEVCLRLREGRSTQSNASAGSQPSKCGRGKPSVVWEHFTEENVSAGCTRALCKQCKQSLVYRNGSKCAGTSHLKRHTEMCLHLTEGRSTLNASEVSVSGSASNPSRKRRRGSFVRTPSGHQDIGMMGGIGVCSEQQQVPIPASNQSLAITQDPIFPSNNKNSSIKESRPCEENAFSIDELEHLLSSEPNPVCSIVLAQESLTKKKENDIPGDSVNSSRGKAVDIGNLSFCSTVKSEAIESLEVVQLVEKPLEATMKTSSAKCPTPSTAVDVSINVQGRVEGFVFVDNFKIPVEYAVLYKKIYEKYGHIATKNVIKSSDTILVACVTDLLRIISAMETKRGVELNKDLLDEWERFIKDAEVLEFNIKWLLEGFSRLKNHWRSSLGIDKEIKSHEHVLGERFVKYGGLCTKKGELETQLAEVKIQISQTADQILFDHKTIQEMKTQKSNFQNEPVLGIVLN